TIDTPVPAAIPCRQPAPISQRGPMRAPTRASTRPVSVADHRALSSGFTALSRSATGRSPRTACPGRPPLHRTRPRGPPPRPRRRGSLPVRNPSRPEQTRRACPCQAPAGRFPRLPGQPTRASRLGLLILRLLLWHPVLPAWLLGRLVLYSLCPGVLPPH